MTCEFTFTRQNACVKCYEIADENCDMCHGKIDYIETIIIPLDTCKEIYKSMVIASEKEIHKECKDEIIKLINDRDSWKKQAESLARAVMCDQISHD